MAFHLSTYALSPIVKYSDAPTAALLTPQKSIVYRQGSTPRRRGTMKSHWQIPHRYHDKKQPARYPRNNPMYHIPG